jgi:hypothetical protein
MLAGSSFLLLALLTTIGAARTELARCVGLRNQLEAEVDVLAHLEVQLAGLQRQIDTARAAVRARQLEVNQCGSMQATGMAIWDPLAHSHGRRKKTDDADDDERRFALSCWSARSSSWIDQSCTCFPPKSPDSKTWSSRPTIRVLSPSSGGWIAGGIDAFLLKIVMEEFMGPTAPIQLPSVPPCFCFGWRPDFVTCAFGRVSC